MASNIVKGWETLPTDEDILEELTNPSATNETVVPEEPVQVIKEIDENGNSYPTKIIYGNLERLNMGESAVIWSEELIRDETTKAVIGVRTTRANGTITEEYFQKDSNNSFDHSTLKYL